MLHLLRCSVLMVALGSAVVPSIPLPAQSPSSAHNVKSTQVFSFPLVESPFINSCPEGEDMLLNGTVHLIVHTSADNNGGTHISIKQSAQGIKGTGETTQTQYEFIQIAGTTLEANGDAPYTVTMVTRMRIVGPGGNNNYFMDGLSHITINGNGTITANFDKFESSCTK